MSKKQIPKEVHDFFHKIGVANGNKLKQEVESGMRDKNYYSNISKLRKTHGRQKAVDAVTEASPVDN